MWLTCSAMAVTPGHRDGRTDAVKVDRVEFTAEEIAKIVQHIREDPKLDATNRVAGDPRAATLGQHLFFDPRFSSNGQISCATCHDPTKGFSDGRQLSDLGLQRLSRHTPSVWNATYQTWQFWDGRADSLWAQALQPIENEQEMGSSRLELAHTLFEDVALQREYEAIFGSLPPLEDRRRFPRHGRPVPENESHPQHVAWANMSDADQHLVNEVIVNFGKAVAAYEHLLVSGETPFDRFARGVRDGRDTGTEHLSIGAQRGLKLFIGPANCRTCHLGPSFSDGGFHNNGLPSIDGGMPIDSGRLEGLTRVLSTPFNAAGIYSDDPDGATAKRLEFLKRTPELWGQFKTPGLRNVATTPPYMHQGQFPSLTDVVRFYSTLDEQVRIGHHQESVLAPLNLTDRDIEDLVAFLESLTGESPDDRLLRRPEAPGQ